MQSIENYRHRGWPGPRRADLDLHFEGEQQTVDDREEVFRVPLLRKLDRQQNKGEKKIVKIILFRRGRKLFGMQSIENYRHRGRPVPRRPALTRILKIGVTDRKG